MTYRVKPGENLFLAIGVPPHEAEVLQFRANVFTRIHIWLRDSGFNRQEAAQALGIEAKVIHIEKCHHKKFSTDSLIDMAGKIGLKRHLSIEE
jgi:predicted XRE-type DNA-binding protein